VLVLLYEWRSSIKIRLLIKKNIKINSNDKEYAKDNIADNVAVHSGVQH